MQHIAILISPSGETFYEAYGPMVTERDKATRFVSAQVAEGAALGRYGRDSRAFWECERRAAQIAAKKYAGWTYKVEAA